MTLTDKVLENGLEMFFSSEDTFNQLNGFQTEDEFEELQESEDIIHELKEIWMNLGK